MYAFEFRDGSYQARWYAIEVALFASLISKIIESLSGEKLPTKLRQRMLPPASFDTEVANEYARLMEQQTLNTKVQNLKQFQQVFANAIGSAKSQPETEFFTLTVPANEVKPALQALTTIRLYLGAELGLTSDDEVDELAELLNAAEQGPVLDHRAQLAGLFFAAGFAQESLVEALSQPSVE